MAEAPAASTTYERDVADIYRHTFAGRLDAHADFLRAGDEATWHWTAVRSELTAERALVGLRDRTRPVSAYMEAIDGSTHVGALDIDRDDGWDLGLRVARVMREAGAAPIVERSRRGAHVWLVLDGVVPSGAMRAALRVWLTTADRVAAGDPKCEIRPTKVEQRGPETLGTALRMPMMAHQRTGKRYPLCDADGTPLGGRVSEVLLAMGWTDAGLVRETADRMRTPMSEVVVPDWARRPAREAGDVVELLQAAGASRAGPGRNVKCPLHDDQVASLNISRDGTRAWCKAPACRAYNGGRGLGADQMADALRG